MDDFFSHENQSYPPALSDYGSMQPGMKADLLSCLDVFVPDHNAVFPAIAEMIILDGAVIVNMIKPSISDTFDDYVAKIMNYICRQFAGEVHRVDMVFDLEISNSEEKGIRNTKTGCRRITAESFSGLVIVTRGKIALSSDASVDVTVLMPCSQDEADTRTLLHASEGVKQGLQKIILKTVDTDVVVLCKAWLNRLELNVCGTAFRYFDARTMAQALGNKCTALPSFHALTGCDVSSFFGGREKRTSWSAWNGFREVTVSLCTLAKMPTKDEILDVMPVIERFVVIIYERGSSDTTVNIARKVLFT
ncbi:hypothetical protein Hamer_G026501, partial [Homarus americanus]